MAKVLFFSVFALFSSLLVSGQESSLKLLPGDVYIQRNSKEDGIHIWIRNKPGISSILITDSSADPEKRSNSYSLRAPAYNPINGDEKRLLNGKFLPNNLYSLIDSTPETNPYFPEGSYHIYIPYRVVYGYPWSRNGEILIGKGSWLNIRTFPKPYADYGEGFLDNPFILSMKDLPDIDKPISDKVLENPKMRTVLDDFGDKINDLAKNTIDVVLVLDTTISMKNNVSYLREKLIPLIEEKVTLYDEFRVAVVLYRDYGEEYLVKPYNFSDNLDEVQKILNAIEVDGGGDIPEAVYEGMYEALTNLKWNGNRRLILQVGDATAHPTPKGDVTKEMVKTLAQDMNVTIMPILLKD